MTPSLFQQNRTFSRHVILLTLVNPCAHFCKSGEREGGESEGNLEWFRKNSVDK